MRLIDADALVNHLEEVIKKQNGTTKTKILKVMKKNIFYTTVFLLCRNWLDILRNGTDGCMVKTLWKN